MDEARLVHISKFLSKYLRHKPHELGIQLDSGGWTSVDYLLEACQEKGFPIDRSTLEQVVAQNNKQRFSFDETGQLIRANQGHSVEVDLQLVPRTPPSVLYHGTGHRSVESIERLGILRGARHHVHLSTDLQTAKAVGARHGRPVVFQIDTADMIRNGYLFYCSDNGVWLTDHIRPRFIERLPDV